VASGTAVRIVTVTTSAPLASRVRRGLGWSLTGNLVLRLGNVLTGIMIARIIAPEQYGTFAVALTVWNVLGTLAEFGLGTDLVRSPDLERRAPTIATLGMLTSGTLALGMVVAAGPIAAAFASPGADGVIRLMAISVALFGLTIVPAARLQRDFRQRALLLCNLSGVATCALVTWALATHGGGAAALAWGQIANQGVIVVGLYVATSTSPRFGYVRDVFRESVAFCLPLAAANLLSWVLISVDNVVVARILGPAGLGVYVLAFNVSSWPMSVVGTALRVVALPGFAQVESADRRNRALVRVIGPTAAVAAFLGLALVTLAGPVIDFLYGSRWSEAALALAGLAVFGALRVVLDLVATFLIAVGATREVLLVQVVWLAVMVPTMVAGVHLFGLRGAGWSHVVAATVVVVPLYLLCLHRVGVDVRLLARQFVVPLAAALPAGLATAWVCRAVEGPPFVVLLAGGATAVLTYALPLRRWCLRSFAALRSASTPVETPHPTGE
jgi:O-antigen/teichoic acid export membrane protein